MDTLLELFRSNFFLIDFAIGGAAPIIVYFLYRTGRVDRWVWALFWLGFAIGLTWEVPMQLLNQMGEAHAVHGYARPLPVHYLVVIFMHSFWDGGLFLLGILLIRLISGGPVLESFKGRELLVLILWGQASELWVETTSLLGEAWYYIPRPWNPSLFEFMGHHVTLMPQLIWLLAPIVFYFAALPLKKRFSSKSPACSD